MPAKYISLENYSPDYYLDNQEYRSETPLKGSICCLTE